DKTVAEAEDGPFNEDVTVDAGADVWWQFVVTNTGNATLTDVVITDTPLGDPIEVGDLAPGESTTIVVRQDGIEEGYTNTATVDGTDPTGGSVTDEDDASVDVVTPPDDDQVIPGLPITGTGAAW